MAITQDYVAWATGNDYKGATFTDGAFTVADMTLTKAGAFAASKANHWLYLTDNGSNEITDGYYRIASVTSANAVVLAASPKSGANDPTDVKCTQHDGTTTLPWRSDQGACDLLTRNTTDGNQVNVLAGVAVVHTVALDLTTFVGGGALGVAAPLIVRGYTSAANDGGVGEIDCAGAAMWAAIYTHVFLADLTIHNFGNNNGVVLGSSSQIFNCTIHKGASSPSAKYLVSMSGRISGCHIYNPGATGACIYSDFATVTGNYIDTGAEGVSAKGVLYSGVNKSIVTHNIVRCGEASAYGISINGVEIEVERNIVCNTTAGTNAGIYVSSSAATRHTTAILNNIVAGWSGAGGAGIESEYDLRLVGYNAFYNNTANYDIADMTFLDQTANDVALAADPFTDAANGDFSLTVAAKAALADAGWPTSYLGAHANTVPNLNIGPIQMAAGGAAGGGFPILGGSVVR